MAVEAHRGDRLPSVPPPPSLRDAPQGRVALPSPPAGAEREVTLPAGRFVLPVSSAKRKVSVSRTSAAAPIIRHLQGGIDETLIQQIEVAGRRADQRFPSEKIFSTATFFPPQARKRAAELPLVQTMRPPSPVRVGPGSGSGPMGRPMFGRAALTPPIRRAPFRQSALLIDRPLPGFAVGDKKQCLFVATFLPLSESTEVTKEIEHGKPVNWRAHHRIGGNGDLLRHWRRLARRSSSTFTNARATASMTSIGFAPR